MVYKARFLKKRVVDSYDPSADETYSVELSDQALAAVWIGIKADLVADEHCMDDLVAVVSNIDINMGGFNVVHYAHALDCIVMNSLLKQNRPMIIGNGKDTNDIIGVEFPILFGSPYIDRNMLLPASTNNRKYLSMALDIANADVDDLLIDVHEVIIPDARPTHFIKQEEIAVAAKGTGDQDHWLQTNWDILKILLKAPTVPVDDAWSCTVNRAGTEIDDFMWGYNNCNWEVLHGEMMDELGGMQGIENHFHDISSIIRPIRESRRRRK